MYLFSGVKKRCNGMRALSTDNNVDKRQKKLKLNKIRPMICRQTHSLTHTQTPAHNTLTTKYPYKYK